MADCCSVPNSDNFKNKHACPTCGEEGKGIPLITLRSLIRRDHPLYPSLKAGFLCPNENDNTVYFFDGHDDRITTKDLVTPYHLKDQDRYNNVCYCFQHSQKEIIDDYLNHGFSTIEKDVHKKVNDGVCTCEVSNPKGKCCLGEIRHVIKGIE